MLSFTPNPIKPTDVRIVPLSIFETYLNSKLIPLDSPLPDHTLPFSITRKLQSSDLNRVFGLQELNITKWIEHLLNSSMTRHDAAVETNILLSPHFSEKV
jgi:hypothetical protein